MKGVTIVTIGDEILIGQTVDTNSAWMAKQLNRIGLGINEIITVSDTEKGIINGLNRASVTSDVVLLTGGLGPTKDDITKKVMADYFGTEMVFHDETWNRIERFFTKIGRKPIEAHRQQCYMPASAELLENRLGTAPAMLFRNGKQVFISMPGVPYEMKILMEDHVVGLLEKEFGDAVIFHRTIMTVGQGESKLASYIEDIANNLPKGLSIAYLPNLGTVKIRVSGRGENQERIEKEVLSTASQIEERVAKYVYGYDDETLAEALAKICIEKKVKIGFAESCTAGLLSNSVTTVPGASAYFEGSILAYSYFLKEKLLSVKHETLINHGAVSEEVVKEMAAGAIETLGVDASVAISGIAGPGGGTPDKPVGTVWIACGHKNNMITKRLSLGKNRLKNNEYSVVQAMNMLRLFLRDN